MASNTKSWSQLVSHQSMESEANINRELNSSLNAIKTNNESFVSLDDVMSEQLANKLSAEEVDDDEETEESVGAIGAIGGQPIPDSTNRSEDLKKFMEESGLDMSQVQQMLDNCTDTSCDELLARYLQNEFDRQHDQNLKKEEKKLNQNSKVGISFDLYRRVKEEPIDSDSDDEFHEYGEDSKHWDSFEKSERQAAAAQIGRQGFVVRNGTVTTKHDLENSARKNAQRVMESVSGLRTGDGGSFDMKLNNNVYNALKVHSMSEDKRMARIKERKGEKSTAEKVLDEKSRIIVFKLVNRGVLETVNGIIATGKESVVLHGRGSMPDRGITSCEVAIKIYKTTLIEFKNRTQYICGDPILQKTSNLSKQNPKYIIPLWAEKEMHNLNRIRRNGVLCPEVLILRKHVLVMTFIGTDGKPAPTLKDSHLTEEQLSKAWKQTVEMMIKLYKDCDLVHSDFSEYNLLWFENKVWCIDVSQSVLSTHPMAFKFLWRDCNNIHKFFAKRCLPELISAADLFTKVCGKQLDTTSAENESNSVDLLDKMENYEKSEELLKYNVSESDDPFEDMLERSARERQTSELSISPRDRKTSELSVSFKNLIGKSPPKSK